ncbi:sulfotransferase 1C3-like isoform X2 [Pecten maximus]|uniref:sulfotransferase 1C3-like isoform X1 n=1 Tax=Pecten maximus TaxID=6579 RepID=UPI001458C9C2|nr:sulfotransferase 1C3-like isoform X1 [Pecten maximus]XP_033740291.1 sulfotransferase 1C3-like isoform X2 [Pecten maximus]
MELVQKTDDQGNTITFKRCLGRTFDRDTRGNVADQLNKIASFRCKADDVLLCTFPRSGTHWVFNMARMIQTKNLQYSGTPEMMEFQDIGVIDEMESPRMFHTHLSYPFIPKGAKEGQLKIIYVLRNPKDAACSYYTFLSKVENTCYSGNMEGYLNAFLSEEFIGSGGSWFTHTKEWNTAMSTNPDLKILFLRFEDLKKNLYRNILRIAAFLEVDEDECFLRKVEQTVTFDNLKKEHATSTGESELWKHLGDNGRMPIYKKGIVGEWKTMLTVAQNEQFDKVYKEKMSDLTGDVDLVYE